MAVMTLSDRPTMIDEPRPNAPLLVHPGWLSSDAPLRDTPDSEVEEARMRFTAFAQTMRTAGALDRASTDILGELGLTAGAFFALLELEAAGEGGIAPSELARRLAVARRTATLYVDILAKEGWVSREAHPHDRRMVLARLTEDGIAMLARVGDVYKNKLGELFQTLSPLQAERLRQLMALIPLEDDTLQSAFLLRGIEAYAS